MSPMRLIRNSLAAVAVLSAALALGGAAGGLRRILRKPVRQPPPMKYLWALVISGPRAKPEHALGTGIGFAGILFMVPGNCRVAGRPGKVAGSPC